MSVTHRVLSVLSCVWLECDVVGGVHVDVEVGITHSNSLAVASSE